MTMGKIRLTAREMTLLQATILVALGLWIYAPVMNGEWIWDDAMLVTQNADLRDSAGLWRSWFAPPVTDYWPVTWTLLWIEWHLAGMNPLLYHLTNIALHLTSAFLLWGLLEKLGLRWGWLGALIFVVHPLTVESVAWVSEIKNTLSLPFCLLALRSYVDADQGRNANGYRWAVVFYLIAMLCKTSVVMLPFVLLLYRWWRHGRVVRADVVRVLPYLGIALVLGLATIHFQNTHFGEDDVVRDRTAWARVVGAGMAANFYLGKFFLPDALLPLYPRWNLNPPSLSSIATLPVLAFLIWVPWTKRKTWGRHVLLGFGFFLLNIAPVVGLLRMTWMNVSWVADHLAYLPIIGLIGCVVAGLEALHRAATRFARPYLSIVIVTLLVLMTAKSRAYAAHFATVDALTHVMLYREWD